MKIGNSPEIEPESRERRRKSSNRRRIEPGTKSTLDKLQEEEEELEQDSNATRKSPWAEEEEKAPNEVRSYCWPIMVIGDSSTS